MTQKVRILFLLRINVQINYFLYQIFLNPSSPERTGYFKRASYQNFQMLSIFEDILFRNIATHRHQCRRHRHRHSSTRHLGSERTGSPYSGDPETEIKR
jgi:hypothetical protein